MAIRENKVLAVARELVEAGYSIIPIARDGSKAPYAPGLPTEPTEAGDRHRPTWKPYQDRRPTEVELKKWFSKPSGVPGLAVVCGEVSGGAECLDFECENSFYQWIDWVREDLGIPFADRLCAVNTPRPGVHVWIRSSVPQAGRKLAHSRPADDKTALLVESRGTGNYALVPGCPRECHPRDLPYRYIYETELPHIEPIAPDERAALFALAEALDEGVMDEQSSSHRLRNNPPSGEDGELRPGDDFDRRGDFAELLERAGWTLHRGDRSKGQWTRPGKGRGCSATLGHCRGKHGEPLLRVFTTGADVDVGCYGAFRFLALTRFGGDLSETSRHLRAEGFGGGRREGKPGKSRPQPTEQAAEQLPGEPWEPAIPFDESLAGPLAKFPLSVLPPRLAEFIRDVGKATNSPPDYAGTFALATAAGALGASLAVRIKRGHAVRPSLYVCVVGRPGSAKTPALDAVVSPVYDEQAIRSRDGLNPIYVSDITVAKLTHVLPECPRGLLVIRDELSGWIASMDEHKSGKGGSDKQFWLSAWSGKPIKQDRKGEDSPPVYVRHPTLSLMGGIQPDALRRVDTLDDGFLDRILFTCPHELPVVGEDWAELAEGEGTLAWHWAEALRRMRAMDMVDGEHGPRPLFLRLSPEAKTRWKAFTDEVAVIANAPEEPDWMRGVASKLRAQAARLAVTLHGLRVAYDVEQEAPAQSNPALSGQSMAGGCELALYFLSHIRRTHAIVWGVGHHRRSLAGKLARWLHALNRPTFTRRDFYRSVARSVSEPDELNRPLALLTALGWIRPDETARSNSCRFFVNPTLPTLETADNADTSAKSRQT